MFDLLGRLRKTMRTIKDVIAASVLPTHIPEDDLPVVQNSTSVANIGRKLMPTKTRSRAVGSFCISFIAAL